VHKIIFVCTGNLCRSPIAEYILKARLAAEGRNDIIVASMGIYGFDEKLPPEEAVEACAEHDIDMNAHRSRHLVPAELKEASFIFVMEMMHKEFFTTFFPQVADRVALLG
jgi:protein-tyrosine phosphatase